jgi:hypothetical protein
MKARSSLLAILLLTAAVACTSEGTGETDASVVADVDSMADPDSTGDADTDVGDEGGDVEEPTLEAGTDIMEPNEAGVTPDSSMSLGEMDAGHEAGSVWIDADASQQGTSEAGMSHEDAASSSTEAGQGDAATPPCGVIGDLSASAGRILDVGHGTGIVGLTRVGNRLLSFDRLGYWVLWDVDARSIIVRGKA